MQIDPQDEFEEKRPKDDTPDEPKGPVGVYSSPETGPEEPVLIEDEWTAEGTTESPEATYSAPEPGSGEIPPPASQEKPAESIYSPPHQEPFTQTPYGQEQKKDKSLAIILEILPAFFGILGIGWIYSGNTNAGIGWLIGFLVWNGIALVLDVITVGIFLCVHIPVNIGIIALSTIMLNNYTKQNPHLFN
jgi:TM2 domain-containing membrane protein YozV